MVSIIILIWHLEYHASGGNAHMDSNAHYTISKAEFSITLYTLYRCFDHLVGNCSHLLFIYSKILQSWNDTTRFRNLKLSSNWLPITRTTSRRSDSGKFVHSRNILVNVLLTPINYSIFSQEFPYYCDVGTEFKGWRDGSSCSLNSDMFQNRRTTKICYRL